MKNSLFLTRKNKGNQKTPFTFKYPPTKPMIIIPRIVFLTLEKIEIIKRANTRNINPGCENKVALKNDHIDLKNIDSNSIESSSNIENLLNWCF